MDKDLKRQMFAYMYGADTEDISIERQLEYMGLTSDHQTDALRYALYNKATHPMFEELTGMKFVEEIEAVYNADQRLAAAMRAKFEEDLLEKKMAIVAQYGGDTFDNGTVLHFKKLFEQGKTAYEYAVLKANGTWHATGRILGFTRGTWEEFVLALVGGNFPVSPEDVSVCDHSSPATDRDLQKTTENIEPAEAVRDSIARDGIATTEAVWGETNS